jgi:hypothetical protein
MPTLRDEVVRLAASRGHHAVVAQAIALGVPAAATLDRGRRKLALKALL